MSHSFDATPKVVSNHSKFKNEQRQNRDSIGTYNKLMQDQRIRVMEPNEQETEYVRLERERIKIENMHSQLIGFKQVKKRMTPYDIKPSPNPKIDANLQFFLTDSKNLPPSTSVVDTQTDAFLPKPESPKFQPKKTGIDVDTQVEDNELFNFDKEVIPIIDIMITKTFEQSVLEIEEECQIEQMNKYKDEFYIRQKAEKNKEKQILMQEIERVKNKNNQLEKFRQKENDIKNVTKKIQSWNICNEYLRDLQNNTLNMLMQQGFYQNELENQIQTNLLDWMVNNVCNKVENILGEKQSGTELVEQYKIPRNLGKMRRPQDKYMKQNVNKRQMRRFNKENKNQQYVRIYYKGHQEEPTQFALHFPKFLNNTYQEHKEQLVVKLQELEDIMDKGEMTDEQYSENHKKLVFDPSESYRAVIFKKNSINKLGYTLAHNKFYETFAKDHQIHLGCFVFDDNNELIEHITPESQSKKYIKYKKNIRDRNVKVTSDEAIVVRFEKAPANAHSFLFYTKCKNITKITPNNNEFQYSHTTMCDYNQNIILDQVDIAKKFKLEEYIKPQEGEEQIPQNLMIFSYFVSQNYVNFGWQLENIHKAINLQDGETEFIPKLNTFLKDSLEGYFQLQRVNSIKKQTFRDNVEGTVDRWDENYFYSRLMDIVHLNIDDGFDKMTKNLVKVIDDDLLKQSVEWGYEFKVKNKSLTNFQQLLKIQDLEDLQFVLNKPVIQQEVEVQEGEVEKEADE